MAETNDSVVLITCDGANMYTPFTKPVENDTPIVLETPVLAGATFKFWRIIHGDDSEETNTDNPLTLNITESLEIRAVYALDGMMYYYMNGIDDTPQGSLSIGQSIIYEMANVGDGANYQPKYLQLVGTLMYQTVNGYKIWQLNEGVSPFRLGYGISGYNDILSGLTDLTFIIAFRHGLTPTSASSAKIMNHYNIDGAQIIGCDVRWTTGKFLAYMGGGAIPLITVYTDARYDDDILHIAVVTYNQTAKTLTVYMEDGSVKSSTDAGFTSFFLDTNVHGQPSVGVHHPNEYTYNESFGFMEQAYPIQNYPLIGDFMFLKGILSAEQINVKANWMADRLGITWTDI